MKHVFLGLLFCLLAFGGYGQNLRLEAQPLPAQPAATAPSKALANYTTALIPTDEVLSFARQAPGENLDVDIQLPGVKSFRAHLLGVDLLSEDFTVITQTPNGPISSKDRPEVYTYQGSISGQAGSQIALTVAEGYLSGYVKLADGSDYFIEPLWHFDATATREAVVIYSTGDVLDTEEGRKCLSREVANQTAERDAPNSRCTAKKIELGIANDYSMVEWMGNQSAVIQHNITITNLVQTNYDDEFAYPVRLQISSIFVSSCADCDPWPPTPDLFELYDAFVDWVAMNGFGNMAIDWASLYTAREFDFLFASYVLPGGLCGASSSTIFSFYDPPLCTQQKIASRALGRCLGAGLAPTGIMTSGGACANFWDPISIDAINVGLETKPCISACEAFPPALPLALAHIFTPTQVCYTFNNVCVASYQVWSPDPYLSITTAGTTVCLQSTQYGARTSPVYISAFDHCGKPSLLGLSWSVNIDKTFGLQAGVPDAHQPDLSQENLSITQNNDFAVVEDLSEVPLSKIIRLYDLSGRLLQEHHTDAYTTQVSLQQLPQGVYVIKLSAGDRTLAQTVYRF